MSATQSRRITTLDQLDVKLPQPPLDASILASKGAAVCSNRTLP